MNVKLKDGLLEVTLSKPEQTKLEKAADICNTLRSLSPIPEKLRQRAATAAESLRSLLADRPAESDDEAGEVRE